MKKILSTALAVVVAAQGMLSLVSAADSGTVIVKPDGAEGKMTVSVTMPEKYENREIYVYILNPGTSLDMLADNDMAANTAVLQYNAQKSYTEGGIEFSFQMNTDYVNPDAEPVYTLWATAEDGTAMSFDFTYYSVEEKEAAIASVAAGAAGASDVEDIYKIFSLQYMADLYNRAEPSVIAKKLNKIGKDITVAGTEKLFIQATLLAAAEAGKLTVDDLVAYNQYIGIEDEVIAEAGNLKEKGEKIVTEDMKVDVSDMDSFKTAAKKALLTAAVYGNVNEGNGVLAEVISAHEDFFEDNGLNISHFDDLDKNNAGKNILSGSRLSFDDLIDEINDMKKSSTSSSSSSGGGGGSSGGGGSAGGGSGSSAMPIVPNPTTAEEKKSEFTDLGEAEWARESIERLYTAGVVSGKEYGIFKPNDKVTREEFVQMITKAFEIEKGKEFVNFDDVPANRWSYNAISIAASNKIVMGDGTSFNPSECITRQDMAAILVRVLNFKNIYPELTTYDLPFEDKDNISEYALESVNILYQNKVVSGKGNNMFAPKDNATRAEAAKMICGALDLMQ